MKDVNYNEDFKPLLPLKDSVLGIGFKRLHSSEDNLTEVFDRTLHYLSEKNLSPRAYAIISSIVWIISVFYDMKEIEASFEGDRIFLTFRKVFKVSSYKAYTRFKIDMCNLPKSGDFPRGVSVYVTVVKALQMGDKSEIRESHVLSRDCDSSKGESVSVTILESLDMADTLVSNRIRNRLQEIIDSPFADKSIIQPVKTISIP